MNSPLEQPEMKWSKGLAEVFSLAWPASLSMLNSTLMRFVDGLLVSKLGADVSAAQFVAGLSAFVPESFATGILTVVNTYVSQNLGAGRPGRCGQYTWAGLLVAVVFCMLIAPLTMSAESIFSLFPIQSQTPRTLGLEVMYFRYMILCVFFSLMSQPLCQFFYGIEKPRIVLIASIVSNVFNLVACYVLIFGVGPFPRLELQGAAIATLLSMVLLVAILAAGFLSRRMHEQFRTRMARAFRWRQVQDLIRTGWPAGVQFFNDILPWTIFTAFIVGTLGQQHLEASTFAMRWMPLSFMPAVGIGIATTALVGRYIGEGRPDLARNRAHVSLAVAMGYMGICVAVFLVLREPMIRFFVSPPLAGADPVEFARQSEEIIRIGGYIMICAAVFQMFDAVGIIFMGALRGAGDTLWPMLYTIACSWGITVFGGFVIVREAPWLGSVGPWMMASLYVIVLGMILAWRFESGQWRKIDLLGSR
jgi:multidrug resistance protein, MATE family